MEEPEFNRSGQTLADRRPPERAPEMDPAAGPVELFLTPIRHWRLLLIAGLIAGIASAAVSLVLPQRFTASTSFIAEDKGKSSISSSGLAALAGQFGVSTAALGMGTGSAQFYADLVHSRSILRALLAAAVPADGSDVPVIELLDVHDVNPVRRLELGERALSERIDVSVDRTTNRITIGVWMHRPGTAKAVADSILMLINRFDRDTRRTTASEKRAFVERQKTFAADSLRLAERAMADFLERNRSYQHSAELSFQHDRLERAIALRQEIFLSLAREAQEARLQEVDTRPVLTIIDPPVLPGKRSWPKRTIIVLMCALVTEVFLWVFFVLRHLIKTRIRDGDSDVARASDMIRAVLHDVALPRARGSSRGA